MNTEHSKTNESNKYIYQFPDKLNHKTPNNKNIGLVFPTNGKTLNLLTTTINLKFQPQLGMMNLISLMVLIQFLTLKINLNLSSKNTKL